MKQYQAGYIIDNLHDVFESKSSNRQSCKELTRWLSHFQIKTKTGFESTQVVFPSLIAVLINLIQRGHPTKLNSLALDEIVKNCSLLEYDNENENAIVLKFSSDNDAIKDLFFRSLHIIDPRLNRDNLKNNYLQSWERLGSNFEENFLYKTLPESIGEAKKGAGDFMVQLLSQQRAINSIIKEKNVVQTLEQRVRTNFEEQRTDFSLEFPYHSENTQKGIVIEIDGPQHQTSEQTYLDSERDQAVVNCGWNNTLRIKTSEFGNTQFQNKITNVLLPALNNDYIKCCLLNYLKPLWDDSLGKEVMQISLIPFAIARIQRILLEAIAHGRLSTDKETWKIAIIERDVPCGDLAARDLQKIIEVINVLTKEPLFLPKIELKIYNSKEFDNSTFKFSKANPIDSFDTAEYFDLVIDIALLDRNISENLIAANTPEIIKIRSVHFVDTKRKIATSELIAYKPFCAHSNQTGLLVIEDKKIEENLEYLLQSIFRKKTFRPGQLPILHNALQCKSVIGLLPTGGGKSLTYQLAALLQPGICLVIDPIRSLMKDQVDGLYRNSIDSCIYINSTLQGEEKRKAMRRLADGAVQFAFISPERLQMEEFRLLLEDMYNEGIYFSYCVIDEAHCVSEWGHDFRTAYLRLGENAIRFCKTKNLEHVPLFGLTATASYDVLADVQRELSGNDESRRLTEEAVIRCEYTKRNELQYVIEEVTFPTGEIKNFWDLKRVLGTQKQNRVKRLLNDIPIKISEFLNDPKMIFSDHDWVQNEKGEQISFEKMQIKDYSSDQFYDKCDSAALVFCPHTKGNFGVTDKFKVDANGMPVSRSGYFDILSTLPRIKAGYFMGSGNDNDQSTKVIQEESFENQDKFINGELNLMTATKAFGMGIDKENIRYTVHINYPGSIESYVQEAGRAGRDRKLALSYILFNDQEVKLEDEDDLVDNDLAVNMYFHKNSFKGISKELAVLDELLTEIHFPDRTFEIENLISKEFEIEAKCSYWEGGNTRNLYIKLGYDEPLGCLNLNTLVGQTDFMRQGQLVKSVMPEISAKIWPLIKQYIEAQNLNEPVHLWIQRSDKRIGIEEILKSKKAGETFTLTVGFYNNAKERVKTITKWLHDVVHPGFSEALVQNMRANCTDAEAFIAEVCDNFEKITYGQVLDFEAFCNNRDTVKKNPKGTAFRMFMALYNGYRDKVDTEKAIYRLSTIGIIDDYTVNFSSDTFTLKGKKKTDKAYQENLKTYLLKYYSEKTTKIRLKNLNEIEEPTAIRKSLNFLVNFVYDNIRSKRLQAIKDMKNACKDTLRKGGEGSVWLKDYIDLYFNSKYARSGYKYIDKKGKEINASLTDITENGRKDELKYVWFFMDVVDEDESGGSQIDNIKHLRGACTRMTTSIIEPSFSIKMLAAFSLYMLEFRQKRYLIEAEELLFDAFSILQEKSPNLSENDLRKIFLQYVETVTDRNPLLLKYMEEFGIEFDFDTIMIKNLLGPLQNAHKTLRSLNEILN